ALRPRLLRAGGAHPHRLLGSAPPRPRSLAARPLRRLAAHRREFIQLRRRTSPPASRRIVTNQSITGLARELQSSCAEQQIRCSRLKKTRRLGLKVKKEDVMKISTWLTTLPATMLAGMSAAHAGWWEDIACKWFGYCAPGGGSGGPVSVSEPAMIAL